VGLVALAILFAACFAYDAKKMTAASISCRQSPR
jgi:hypothetical protein